MGNNILSENGQIIETESGDDILGESTPSEYVDSGIVGMMLEIGGSGIRTSSKLLWIGR